MTSKSILNFPFHSFPSSPLSLIFVAQRRKLEKKTKIYYFSIINNIGFIMTTISNLSLFVLLLVTGILLGAADELYENRAIKSPNGGETQKKF